MNKTATFLFTATRHIFNGKYIGGMRLFMMGLTIIWHICGGECLSIADIAYRVADYFKLDRSLIIPVTTEEMNEATPRPRFSGLSIEKAKRELGYTPHTLEEGMAEMRWQVVYKINFLQGIAHLDSHSGTRRTNMLKRCGSR